MSPPDIDIRSTGPLSSLEALRSTGAPVLLSMGGSALTALRTPTSDTDFFAVGPPEALPIARSLVSALPKTDLEMRELGWLDALETQLQAYRPPVHGGPSPFSFMDLRFLARILHGHALVDEGGVLARIEPLREPLRVALATYISSWYTMVYEDAVGLFLAERYLEIVPIAGELAQRACLLAMLQTRLVEPSPKWALTLAATTGDERLRSGARKLSTLLCRVDTAAPRAWAESLLRLCNAVVALGRLGAMDPAALGVPAPAAADAGRFPPELCLMGIPGHQTLLDTRANTLHVWNLPWLVSLAASAEMEQA